MIVKEPTELGLNELPLTPVPDHVPPTGVPTKFKEAELWQIVVSLPAFTEGNARTTIVLVAVEGQPLMLVPVTEYVVVAEGVATTIRVFVALKVLPGDQE